MRLFRRRTENACHGLHESVPAAALFCQVRPAGRSNAVVLGLPVVFGGAPEGSNQSTVLEAIQRRIERSVFDLEDFFGRLLDTMGDGVAVRGAEQDCP